METVVIILYVMVSFLLAVAILLQPGKGSGMGALGGGPAGGMFGARGAVPFLAKMTVYLGIAFGVLVLVLARMNMDTPSIEVTPPTDGAPAATAPAAGAATPAEAPAPGAAAPAPGAVAPAAPAEGAAAPAPAPAEAPAAPAPAAPPGN